MEFRDESARRLFLMYALPCAPTLIRRGVARRAKVNALISSVSSGKNVPENAENIFSTALGLCKRLSLGAGKGKIRKSDIRKYFLFEHDKAIATRFRKFGDFDPEKCRTYPGKVLSVGRGFASIATPRGTGKYRMDFIPVCTPLDYVVVHRNFAVEKISKSLSDRLWKSKAYIPGAA